MARWMPRSTRSSRDRRYIEENGKISTGRGMDLDVVVASAKAIIEVLNRMSFRKDRIEGI